MSTHDLIEQQAAEWLLKREEPEWSAADQTALDAWLAESTAHEVAYLRLEHGWRRADRLKALPPPDATPKPSRRALLWIAPLAATILLAAVLGTLEMREFTGEVYTTAVGGHETVPLADGSKIELNTNTKVRVAVADAPRPDEADRTVWLDRGEAFFDVAHDPKRPFTVYAGDRKIVVLGTKFSVRRQIDPKTGREDVRVAVLDGRVRVEPAGGGAGLLRREIAAPASVPADIATPGDVVIARGGDVQVRPDTVDAVAQSLTWRQGMLAFDRSTLSDAAAEFNRYNRIQIIVTDAGAANLRIGGTFEANNVEAFARILQRSYGLKVQRADNVIRIAE